MKKLFFGLFMSFMLLLCSCGNKEVNNLDDTINYIDSLNSYSLTCDMKIYRDDKEIESVVSVDYLKPSYYKVKFSTPGGHEQIIVKNNEGVFIVTPSLNKQFKFDTEWPLNSSHAYLLNAIIKDIKEDSNRAYKLDGSNVIIESCISDNLKYRNLKFYFNIVDRKPIKTEFINSEGNVMVLVEFKDFNANNSLTTDLFNPGLILEQNTNESTVEEEETNASITVSNVLEGSTLESSKTLDDCTILVYGGEKKYTIIAKETDVYESCIAMEEYNNFEIINNGLLLSGDNYYRYFVNDYEISVYSTALTIDDVLNVISDGIIIE